MHIGLIGGIGPAATNFYYQRLIKSFAHRKESLELTIVHADSSTLLKNLVAGNEEAQVAIYQRLTERLAQAGADCVVVTSISGHFCINNFKSISPLPVVDMIEEVQKHIQDRGLRRIGILGTRTVMETKLYGAIDSAEILHPKDEDLAIVHHAYVEMALTGQANESQRTILIAAVERLIHEHQVEAVMLGGTDLALIFRSDFDTFPLIDCAAVHVDAIVKLALD